MRKYQWCGLAGFLAATSVFSSAHATDFTVTDTADSYVQGDGVCSLREAVDTANYNDCWTDCGCGSADELDHVWLSQDTTYTLDSTLYIWDALMLWGNYAVVRGADGGGDFGGIVVQQTWYTELRYLALENFRRSALGIDENAAAYTYGLEVRNNNFQIGGGQNASVTLLSGAYLYMQGADIHDNINNIKGGGIFLNPNAWLDLEWSSIHDNEVSQYGGGIHNQGYVYCYGGSIVYANHAVYGGGGIYNTTPAVFDGPSNECYVVGNSSTTGGADIGGHP